MLEQMRRSSRSLLIYLLFGIVIAVFIINFGPQSKGGCEGGQALQGGVAAKVGGNVLAQGDFRYGFLMSGGGQFPAQQAKQFRLKETVMDRLIERELLATEAERMGFRVSEEEVEDLLGESKIVGRGMEQTATSFQKDGKFDYESFRKFVQFQLGMTPKAFIEQQRRELLAQRVRNLLRDGVTASVAEVQEEFVRKNNQANVEYVRFATRRYESDIEPTAAELAAYATANEKKLKELYEQRKFLYEKAPKERRLRQILVKLDAGASADADAAAKKKAEALLARIKKGEAFALVAKTASEDTHTKPRGGDLGWRRQGATALGPGVEDKVWAAKDGDTIGPEKASDGYYLVLVEGTREGDIPFDKVKAELAETELRQDRAKAKAKSEAEAALAKMKAAPDKTLKDLFPAPKDKEVAKDDAKGVKGVKDVKDAKGVKTAKDAPIDDPDAPRAEETGLFARRGAVVENIGTSAELAKLIFDLTTAAPFGGPVEVAGSYLVVRLKERKSADLAEFEKKKIELVAEASAAKGEKVIDEWALRRCSEAKDAKRIEVNREFLRYDEGPEVPVNYEPCSPPAPFRL